jgi:hypothetical protein
MRLALDVAVRAVAFVVLWLAWPDSPTTGLGAAWLLFATISLVGLLWGVVDGLLWKGPLTTPILRWVLAGPAVALLVRTDRDAVLRARPAGGSRRGPRVGSAGAAPLALARLRPSSPARGVELRYLISEITSCA